MPATSIAQQRLMGQAYAIKKGDLKPTDLNPDYRDEIVKLADSMTLKQLKDFAETKHSEMKKENYSMKKSLPTYEDFLEEDSMATPSSVNGMGAPSMPGSPGTQSDFATQKAGSGDIPMQLSKGKPKKKKKSSFINFRDFIKGSEEVRSAF